MTEIMQINSDNSIFLRYDENKISNFLKFFEKKTFKIYTDLM